MAFIEISVEGLDKLIAALKLFPAAIKKNMGAAGDESLNMVLDTVGLRSYPPETAANRPPTPYYVRGVGTQTNFGNLGGSENYKHKWKTEAESFIAKATNTASYNQPLGGENQVWWAAGYGWKKLFSTAKALIPEIVKIYTAWVEKTIKELGL